MSQRELFEGALRSDEPFKQLYESVRQLIADGGDRNRLYDELHSLALELRAAGREAEDDTILEVLDCLVGFCNPDMRL